MKRCLSLMSLFFSSALFACSTIATQQILEEIIVDNLLYQIESNPLESLYDYDEIHLMLETEGFCSANWRGYKGVWEIKNDQLYLNSLVKGACDRNAPTVDPEFFFGEKSYPLKAAWFSGRIEVRTSERQFETLEDPDGGNRIHIEKYTATVYEFSSGDLVYKADENIEQQWD